MNMLERYIEEKIKIFDTLSNGLLSKSRQEIENYNENIKFPMSDSILSQEKCLSSYARMDHIINYVFKLIE